MYYHWRRSSIVVLQGLLIVCSLTLAWLLRFEFTCPQPLLLVLAMPFLLLFRMAAMRRFGLLHGYWRYAGYKDFEDLILSVMVGSLGFIVSIRYVLGILAFPLSVYILEALLTTAFLGGARFLFRGTQQRRETALLRNGEDIRVLVVGAGSAAEELIRQLPRHGYRPLACVDDDPKKLAARIHGVPVVGAIGDLPWVVKRYDFSEIMIAIASLTASRMREVIQVCQTTGVRFRTIPAFSDLVGGRVTVGQLREVVLEDLLSRDPVEIDLEHIRQSLRGKRVLVTGAAGSIGSELCQQILGFTPARLICLDQDESGIFFLSLRLQELPGAECSEYVVADVTDRQRIAEALVGGVDVVFHAAAYKHVPLMETNVAEAIWNNIGGLGVMLEQAESAGADTFVLISSDKAVNPSSVMGCTKRVGELMIAARPRTGMRCVAVRFGNVLGSQGSVVPTFREQILQGRVTVTHPEITRFFMTIPEAVSLVLQATTVGGPGEVMVLDMGEPVRIADLARTLISMVGKTEEEVEIVYTGLRKGEKLFEELFYASEEPLPTSCDKVRRAKGPAIDGVALKGYLEQLQQLVYSRDSARLRAKLKEIVPEYSYSDVSDGQLALSRNQIPAESTEMTYFGSLRVAEATD